MINIVYGCSVHMYVFLWSYEYMHMYACTHAHRVQKLTRTVKGRGRSVIKDSPD